MTIETGLGYSEALDTLHRRDRTRRRGRALTWTVLVLGTIAVIAACVLADQAVWLLLAVYGWWGLVAGPVLWRRPDLLTGSRFDGVQGLDEVRLVSSVQGHVSVRGADGTRRGWLVAADGGRALPDPGIPLWAARTDRYAPVPLIAAEATGPLVLWPRTTPSIEIPSASGPDPATGTLAGDEECAVIRRAAARRSVPWLATLGIVGVLWLFLLLALPSAEQRPLNWVNAINITAILAYIGVPRIRGYLAARRVRSFERVQVLDVDRYGYVAPTALRVRLADGRLLRWQYVVGAFSAVRIPKGWVWASTPVEPGRRLVVFVAEDERHGAGGRLLTPFSRAREFVDLDLTPGARQVENGASAEGSAARRDPGRDPQ